MASIARRLRRRPSAAAGSRSCCCRACSAAPSCSPTSSPDLDDAISCRPLRIDLDETVADAAESVLAAAPDRFALAGHSLGGIVALEVLRRAPHRVARLALLNSSARPPSDAQLEAWAQLRARTEDGEFAAVVAEQAATNVGEPAAGRPELVERWIDIAARRRAGRASLRQLSMQASRRDGRAVARRHRRADARASAAPPTGVPAGDPGRDRRRDPGRRCT